MNILTLYVHKNLGFLSKGDIIKYPTPDQPSGEYQAPMSRKEKFYVYTCELVDPKRQGKLV